LVEQVRSTAQSLVEAELLISLAHFGISLALEARAFLEVRNIMIRQQVADNNTKRQEGERCLGIMLNRRERKRDYKNLYKYAMITTKQRVSIEQTEGVENVHNTRSPATSAPLAM
jgi:hypothetical protein